MSNFIHDADQLLRGYESIIVKKKHEKLKEIKQLVTRFKILLEAKKQEQKQYAPEYNIFNILNVNWLETKLHTPFLVNLFDPQGSHGQGVLFYNRFIESNNLSEYFIVENENDIEVIEEKSIPDGRIDIYIRCLLPDKKFVIIIENKIYAADQENQLGRYYNYFNSLGYGDSQLLIFYLKDGSDPSFYSISKELRKELQRKKVLLSISYSNHISDWLFQCISEIEPQTLKIIISQYLNIIKSLHDEI